MLQLAENVLAVAGAMMAHAAAASDDKQYIL